ncbi:MAG: YdcF family protein [Myxococcales bacterium]|nr:YdcF family protein [Myxococcales bacterium]
MNVDHAIVILGCRVELGGDVRGALKRRVTRGARLFHEQGARWVVVSGGKRWHGFSEAGAMRRELERLGVPSAVIVEETRSCSTRENAVFSQRLLQERGVERVNLVTCDFHMRRAAGLFRCRGLNVQEFPARSPGRATNRARRAVSELVKTALDRYAPRAPAARCPR